MSEGNLFQRDLDWKERAAFMVAALVLIYPGWLTDLVGCLAMLALVLRARRAARRLVGATQ